MTTEQEERLAEIRSEVCPDCRKPASRGVCVGCLDKVCLLELVDKQQQSLDELSLDFAAEIRRGDALFDYAEGLQAQVSELKANIAQCRDRHDGNHN